MEKIDWKDLSDTALLKMKKSYQVSAYLLMSFLLVLLSVGLYLTFSQSYSPILIIPIALSPILIKNFKRVKAINALLAERHS